MPTERFRAEAALTHLKTFQRRTVDYVFERFYGKNDPVHQFLVADEVGLGKTLVARGIIARTIEHLWDTTRRIDILYICSNQAIAAQNLNRLNVLGRRELALPTRMTLIPLQLRGENRLDANKVNFFSLTPGTSFDLRSATGVKDERAFLYHLLHDLVSRPHGLHNLLQVTAGPEGWKQAVDGLDLGDVDRRILDRVRREVREDSALFEQLQHVCNIFRCRQDTYPPDMTRPRNELVAALRERLSHACVEALEPDLIIMDEFQRFRDLLHGDSDAATLARALFDYSEGEGHAAKTLLLSATPYRMLTLAGDAADDGDHYQDFLETLKFLYGRERGEEVVRTLASETRRLRGFLQGLPGSYAEAVDARQGVERRLRQVIARTERIGSTVNRDSMMDEPPVEVAVAPADLVQAASISNVARILDAPEIVEYWKSAPYLLNFMRDYKLKRLLEAQAGAPSVALRRAIRAASPAMLDRKALARYAPLEVASGRMRALMDEVFGAKLHRCLWIPAAMPYYGSKGSGPPPTKALVFSSWSMVPDAIAALLSYEAERRMGDDRGKRRYFAQQSRQLLHFRTSRGRLTGLRALLLVYPSPTLAELADPLAVFAKRKNRQSTKAMRGAIAGRLRSVLGELRRAADRDQGAPVAGWAAPAVIDDLRGTRSGAWLTDGSGMRSLADEDGFREHVDALAAAAAGREFGAVPDGLRDLVVDVALGSPAVCALRALRRIAPELHWDDPDLLSAAARVAWGFRTLFNQNDAIALLRQDTEERYWRSVLAYCADHNLQAVLDEYAHFLVDAEGLGARSPGERAAGVARAMAAALSIRPSQIDVDDLRARGRAFEIEKFRMRGRFAMRLADYRDEDDTVSRLGAVRDAFNSPFRPFVLATTSVGQEGLDFHPYCHRIWHWNLPGNPVDLEQREGRVHRFKGHAVRLNLAERQAAAIRGSGAAPDDPWQRMFERERSGVSAETELIPYWICEGSAKIERRVPMLPFSREITRLAWLKRSLAVYRLAFGQPRQDDLLEYLQTLEVSGADALDLESLQIRLEPVAGKSA